MQLKKPFPVILLGTNSNITKLVDLIHSTGREIRGIIDDDYYENPQSQFKDISVLGTEQILRDDPGFYRNHFEFICATNWTPDAHIERNRQKRSRQLALIDELGLNCATIIGNQAVIGSNSRIGAGTVIYDFAVIEPEVTIGEHSIIYDYAIVGHESHIGSNVVLQRKCLVTSLVTVEDDVYMGLHSSITRSNVRIGQGTFLHPGIMILRSTERGETVSLVGRDLRKAYQLPVTE